MEPRTSDKIGKVTKDSYVKFSYLILLTIGFNVIGWGIYLVYLLPSEYAVTLSAYLGLGVPFLISSWLVKKRTAGGHYKGLILLFIGLIIGFYFVSPYSSSQMEFGIFSVESPVGHIPLGWHIIWLVYAWAMEALDFLAFYMLFVSKDKFPLTIGTKWNFRLKIASIHLVAVMGILILYGIFYEWDAVTAWIAVVLIIHILWPWELVFQSTNQKF